MTRLLILSLLLSCAEIESTAGALEDLCRQHGGGRQQLPTAIIGTVEILCSGSCQPDSMYYETHFTAVTGREILSKLLLYEVYGQEPGWEQSRPLSGCQPRQCPCLQLPLILHPRLITEGIPCPPVAGIAVSVFWTGASCKWALAVLPLIRHPLACVSIWTFV